LARWVPSVSFAAAVTELRIVRRPTQLKPGGSPQGCLLFCALPAIGRFYACSPKWLSHLDPPCPPFTNYAHSPAPHCALRFNLSPHAAGYMLGRPRREHPYRHGFQAIVNRQSIDNEVASASEMIHHSQLLGEDDSVFKFSILSVKSVKIR
jgi:hypothetical protein